MNNLLKSENDIMFKGVRVLKEVERLISDAVNIYHKQNISQAD